jgi:hypothetical protein
LGFICIKADLDLRRFELQPFLYHATHLIDTSDAVVPDRRIERQLGTPGTTEKLVHWLAQQLPFEIP